MIRWQYLNISLFQNTYDLAYKLKLNATYIIDMRGRYRQYNLSIALRIYT